MHHQVMHALALNGQPCSIELPPAEESLLPGIRWGAFDVLLTPAFWAGRVFLATIVGDGASYRLGTSLREEVAACLLGGYGMKAEVGLAAFRRLRDEGLLIGTPSRKELTERLSQPIRVGARTCGYRFARQKAAYLAQCLARLPEQGDLPLSDRALRTELMTFPGIGPKTASWIVRNWRDSDEVAIIDIHVWRACVVAGVFSQTSSPSREYGVLEDKFLSFALAIRCRPSVLDNVIWREMRGWVHPGPSPSLAPERRRRRSKTARLAFCSETVIPSLGDVG